ncbi:MAG: ABC transporter permease [Bacteroidota bacterium]
MTLFLNMIEAIRAIRANFLRTVLTVMIIAFGLTALIGVLTSIDGIKYWFSNSFIRLGANTFRIENYTTNLRRSGGGRKAENHPPITYDQALAFQEDMKNVAVSSVVGTAGIRSKAKYKNKSTDANLMLLGGDANFIQTDNYTIAEGRNINSTDVEFLKNVILLGDEPVRLLFDGQSPLGKTVYFDGKAYRVIGTFESVGSQSIIGGDKACVIPNSTMRKDFPGANSSFGIHVAAPDVNDLDNLVFEAVGSMRRVRSLKPREPNDFGIIKVDQILKNFLENLRYLTWSATAIALITLLSAAIGLMNIMLVSVTERTREIGLRKAMGATRGNILFQFLTEAVLITQLGGLVGVAFGIAIGNLVGLLLGSPFLLPWDWVALGMSICFVVGLVAGIYPARKAAYQDPIEALRYE